MTWLHLHAWKAGVLLGAVGLELALLVGRVTA